MSPLTKWACPSSAPTYGETHIPLYCITECTNKCLSPFLLAALTNSVQGNHHRGKYLSATSLSGCVRKLKAERTIDYSDEPRNQFYAYRGTVMHQVLDDASGLDLIGNNVGTLYEAGFLSEFRMAIGFCFEHGGFKLHKKVSAFDESTWTHLVCPSCKKESRLGDLFILGGTLDGFEPIWEEFDHKEGTLWGHLHDLKTMAEYAVKIFIQGDKKKNTYHPHIKDSHFIQANIYKYLLERSAPPPNLKKRGVKRFKLRSGNIQAFSMNDAPRTGAAYSWTPHYTQSKSNWDIPSIEFETEEFIENYIRTKGRPVYEALIKGAEYASICEPEKNSRGRHSWQCDFCSFAGSYVCPNPKAEWEHLQNGKTPEEAFILASNNNPL